MFWLGSKKNNKHETDKRFSDATRGTIVPGTNHTPVAGTAGQNGGFSTQLNRKRPVCLRDGVGLSQARSPVCPRDGSLLSWTPVPFKIFVNFAGVLRGNTIRGNTTRNSERKMAL